MVVAPNLVHSPPSSFVSARHPALSPRTSFKASSLLFPVPSQSACHYTPPPTSPVSSPVPPLFLGPQCPLVPLSQSPRFPMPVFPRHPPLPQPLFSL
ncbi:pollen-specific leucine-rich repeat extensin-like protein 3 [Micropterus dolomieu]|uniref:pollen-specific leucine-rich repeat extensin-like protein 3 n=1 Tax=Micropterus dolomieu TaxID=147949 RepID=UPI001E8E351F|nr:pollen-specific leucine-rich repeat extensin-like protein 3 [Micropterus dolomieu]